MSKTHKAPKRKSKPRGLDLSNANIARLAAQHPMLGAEMWDLQRTLRSKKR